jgi:hypothetical protein
MARLTTAGPPPGICRGAVLILPGGGRPVPRWPGAVGLGPGALPYVRLQPSRALLRPRPASAYCFFIAVKLSLGIRLTGVIGVG